MKNRSIFEILITETSGFILTGFRTCCQIRAVWTEGHVYLVEFWGVLHFEFVSAGQAVNTVLYVQQLWKPATWHWSGVCNRISCHILPTATSYHLLLVCQQVYKPLATSTAAQENETPPSSDYKKKKKFTPRLWSFLFTVINQCHFLTPVIKL